MVSFKLWKSIWIFKFDAKIPTLTFLKLHPQMMIWQNLSEFLERICEKLIFRTIQYRRQFWAILLILSFYDKENIIFKIKIVDGDFWLGFEKVIKILKLRKFKNAAKNCDWTILSWELCLCWEGSKINIYKSASWQRRCDFQKHWFKIFTRSVKA